MADLNDLLMQFERKLKELKGADELTSQAPAVFKQFAEQVERRNGAERRRADRSGEQRRRPNEAPHPG
ncbi:MAG: hypothetical protein ABIQ52_15780 [Vicinamibacterales bacterium]